MSSVFASGSLRRRSFSERRPPKNSARQVIARFEVIAAIIEDELDLGVRFWNFQAETYKLGKL